MAPAANDRSDYGAALIDFFGLKLQSAQTDSARQIRGIHPIH